MNSIQRRIAELSPEKRQLLDILLRERGAESAWGSAEYVEPRTPVEQTLAEIWAKTLGLPRVGVYDNFFELGGDSIQSIQILAKARHAGIHLNANQMFAHPTIAELAELATAADSRPGSTVDPVGPVPLTPIQAWFFEQRIASPQHWNQAVLLECGPEVHSDLLSTAFRHLVRHHDALRLRWQNPTIGAGQTVAADESAEFFLTVDAPDDINAVLKTAHETLDLVNGPIFRAVFVRTPEGRNQLLVVAHHLAVDAVSFRILFDDLETVCRQVLAGESPRLPARTSSFREWALRLSDYAASREIRNQIPVWEARSHPSPMPLDCADGENLEGSVDELLVSLPPEETEWVRQRAAAILRSQVDDMLLAALYSALLAWGIENPLIDVEGHGRLDRLPGLDLSRTVGWFTTIAPLSLQIAPDTTPAALLQRVKEVRRITPDGRIGFGLLRYLSRDSAVKDRLQNLPQADVSFNYLGQFDHVLPAGALFRPLDFAPGPLYSPQAKRRYVLQVTARIQDGQLRLSCYYSRNLHRRETMDRLCGQILVALRQICNNDAPPEPEPVRPADFPLAGLSQQDLDRLVEI